MRDTKAKGDCMFVALSQQIAFVLKKRVGQVEIRREMVKYLRENPTTPGQTRLWEFLVDESWEEYLDRMQRSGEWGDNLTLQAAANVYQVEILLIMTTGVETTIEPHIRHEPLPKIILGFDPERHYVSLQTNEADDYLPTKWTNTTSPVELVTISSGSTEYQDVSRDFLSSIGSTYQRTIVKIQRVQSKTLWKLYCVKKQEMDTRDPGVPNENILWHGTSGNSVAPIYKNGFDMRYCGKNATIYGDGVYFSTNSRYSTGHRYSVPDDDGYKYVFQARVLTGRYIKGESGMRVPPWRDEQQHLMYDSVVDSVDKPNIYVIFYDAQAYPDYLIVFK